MNNSSLLNYKAKNISIMNCRLMINNIKEAVIASSGKVDLDLSENDICDNCMEIIGRELFSNYMFLSRLNSINLSLNRLTIRGLAYMTECFRSPYVKEIDLRYNYLDEQALEPYVTENRCIYV